MRTYYDRGGDKAVVEVARDGLQVVEAFKNSREGELEAIIAMTANAFVEDMRKTKEAGMNEHLTKPVDGEKLLQVLYRYKKTGL